MLYKLEADELARQLSEPFTPDDAFVFGSRTTLAINHNLMISTSESLSLDEVFLLPLDFCSYPRLDKKLSCLKKVFVVYPVRKTKKKFISFW